MAKVKILCTSSGAVQFAPERYQKYDIDIVSLHITFKGVDRLEKDVDPQEFYSQLETLEDPKNNLPKTSLPSVTEFKEHYDKAVEEGYDTILVFTLSTGLSGSYGVACSVAKEYEGKIKIHVVDTKTAAFCEGIHAVKAAEMLEKGMSVEDVLKETEWAIAHQEFLGTDAKLDYLIYNGRLKGAKAFMGKMLKICPVLQFSRDGFLEAVESVRTQKKAINRMCEKVLELIGDRKPEDYILFRVFTGASMEEALIEAEAKTGLKPNHESVVMTPSSGSHNGPWLGAYGLYMLRREDEAL